MSNIFIPNEKNSNKLKEKDCNDFTSMGDGTITGDPKYCSKSFICRQLGMRSDYVWFSGPALGIRDGNIQMCLYSNMYDYMCTGKYAKEEDKGVDEEIS